ncbi:hypothetical protein SAMN05216315_12022 [Nitrosospira sp. Nsp18]|nr:hypothetical protein SAMN05216315_12022 [Nitrosospira sp. Nsp18]
MVWKKSFWIIRPLSFGHVATVALFLLCTGCVHTVPFTDAKNHIIPGSIATMETVTIGGISQSIWFRGVTQSNLALILLH